MKKIIFSLLIFCNLAVAQEINFNAPDSANNNPVANQGNNSNNSSISDANPQLDLSKTTVENRKNIKTLLDFMNNTGSYAGAVSACDNQEYVKIKSCVLYYVDDTLSKVDDMATRKELAAKTKILWMQIINHAYSLQASDHPPQTCNQLLENEKQAEFWKMCPSNTIWNQVLSKSPNDIQNGNVQVQ